MVKTRIVTNYFLFMVFDFLKFRFVILKIGGIMYFTQIS